MSSDRFLMDHGAGHRTLLHRQQITLFGIPRWVWRETPPGTPKPKTALQFADDDGCPVDTFGLPLFGSFIDVSLKDN